MLFFNTLVPLRYPLGKAIEQNGYELIVPDVPFFKNTVVEGVKKR